MSEPPLAKMMTCFRAACWFMLFISWFSIGRAYFNRADPMIITVSVIFSTGAAVLIWFIYRIDSAGVHEHEDDEEDLTDEE